MKISKLFILIIMIIMCSACNEQTDSEKIAGSKGEKGLQGDVGPQGEKGVQGDIGLQGEKGLQGNIGPQGVKGLQGSNGAQGENGLQGNAGIQGEKGLQGNPGPQGEPSDHAFNFSYPDNFKNYSILNVDSLKTTNYTVPVGKNIYILNIYSDEESSIYIDNLPIFTANSNFIDKKKKSLQLGLPIILGEHHVISSDSDILSINGLIVDRHVAPVVLNNLYSTPHTISSSKRVVILQIYSDGDNQIKIDGKIIFKGKSNFTGKKDETSSLGNPILVSPSSQIASDSDDVVINGYMVEI